MDKPMFELNNHQRACLGLAPVEPHWELIQLIPSPYDTDQSYAYIEGTRIHKYIRVNETSYMEYSMNEILSDDRKYILPKTEKGKPVKLSAATLGKKTPIGMAFSWSRDYITVYNATSQQSYYRSSVELLDLSLKTMPEFLAWLDKWCTETTDADLADVAAFTARERVHQKFREGDFFRFRLDRRHWAYGRILLDFAAMRKQKIEFWDVFFGKPLVVAVYRTMTAEPLDDIEKLAGLPMLPSQFIMDNIFYYGEAEIIGNMPLTPEEEDFPINYGKSKDAREKVLYLQCGRLYRKIKDGKPLVSPEDKGPLSLFDFSFCGIGWNIHVRIPILKACIRENSNRPYWEQPHFASNQYDLRNPKLKAEREAVFEQFGLNATDYVKEEIPAKESFFDHFKKK